MNNAFYNESMVDYELIDHTADIGIKVRGNSLEELFVNAASAMFDIIAQKPFLNALLRKKEFPVSFKAVNKEELLVRWLSELLSLSDCEAVFFTDFKILSLNEKALEAKALGMPQKLFKGKREVKAVTYHALKIVEEGKAFTAEIIFDV